jgi:Tol biopolymer transport system component
MGVVYRALDTKLQRVVALKRLRPDRFSDQESRRLLMNEARAASRLSHPNIVRIYDAFESEGVAWIVMEYVEGRSLRGHLKESGALGTGEVLRYAEELAAALGAAHAQRVLHRDVNPRNILITRDAHARLTDFGVACAYVPPGKESGAARLGRAALPPEGSAGTPGYMSPEQVLGRHVDPRSDLFSLGLVIYEMCTGRPAFTATPEGNAADAVLHREPMAIALLNKEVPGELIRIVGKAMAKQPETRYQDAGDLVADLRRSRRSPVSVGAVVGHNERRLAGSRLLVLVAASLVLTMGAAILIPWLIRHGFTGLISNGLGGDWQPPAAVPHQLTSDPGWEGEPALSPDGELVAYTSNQSGNRDIWIIDVRGGQPLRLTDDPAADNNPAWFPDGKSIAFTSERGGHSGIWKVQRFGGSPLLLVPDARDPSVSPDGKQIAFAKVTAAGKWRIHVAPVSDPAQARVLTGDSDGMWFHFNPRWSPDGKTLCYQAWHTIWTVPAAGGPARCVIEDYAANETPSWSPDSGHIYFSSSRDGTRALWRIPVEGGIPRRVTFGTGPETEPDVSADGRCLVYSTHAVNWDILLFNRITGGTIRIGGARNDGEPALSPDGGRLLFVSDREGSDQLYLQSLVGGQPQGLPVKLTDLPTDVSRPAFSPDGRWISFYSKTEGRRDVWVMPAGGGRAARFTESSANDIHPAWSPDGSSIAFASDRDGRSSIWVAPVSEGLPAGPARRITTGTCIDWFPDWSLDGSSVAFVRACGDKADAWIVPADGSADATRVTDTGQVQHAAWDPSTGRLLVRATWDDGSSEIRQVDPATRRVTRLVPPLRSGDDASGGTMSVSRDGRLIALMVEEVRGDIWVLEGGSGSYE